MKYNWALLIIDFPYWLFLVSDVLIWTSSIAIFALIIQMLIKQSKMPFPRLAWFFMAFVALFTGTTLADHIVFNHPVHLVHAILQFFSAITTVLAAYYLFHVLPFAFAGWTISERKAVERKLELSEFLIKETGHLARVGGWEFDPDTRKRTWSLTVYDIFGIPHDTDLDELDTYSFFLQSSQQKLKQAVSTALTQGTGWDLELQMTTAAGRGIWVRSYGKAYAKAEKSGMMLKGLFMDIDKYKTNEEALTRSHNLMFQRHQQLKTFTYTLSHHIRNHSTNIAQLMGLVEKEGLEAQNLEIFEKMLDVSTRLDHSIQDLTKTITACQNEIVAETLSFKDTAGQVVEILRTELLGSHAKVKFDFEIEHITFPKLYLESIIMNLISNSLKYRKKNEAPIILLQTYENEQGRTVLSCKDNGQGIDLAAYQDRIFELYNNFDANEKPHGVGLFVVKSQVESQGGKIAVASEPGKGAEFIITF